MKAKIIVLILFAVSLMAPVATMTAYAHAGETHETIQEDKKHEEEKNGNNATQDNVDSAQNSKDSKELESPAGRANNFVIVIATMGLVMLIVGLILVVKKL